MYENHTKLTSNGRFLIISSIILTQFNNFAVEINYDYMIRRYKKLKVDMPLSAAEIEDITPSADIMQQDVRSSANVFYLHLSPSIFIYLPLSSFISLYIKNITNHIINKSYDKNRKPAKSLPH